MVGNLTLAVVCNNDRNLSPVYIDDGLYCRSQFTIGGRKEMMGRLDNGELCTWAAACSILYDPLT